MKSPNTRVVVDNIKVVDYPMAVFNTKAVGAQWQRRGGWPGQGSGQIGWSLKILGNQLSQDGVDLFQDFQWIAKDL